MLHFKCDIPIELSLVDLPSTLRLAFLVLLHADSGPLYLCIYSVELGLLDGVLLLDAPLLEALVVG